MCTNQTFAALASTTNFLINGSTLQAQEMDDFGAGVGQIMPRLMVYDVLESKLLIEKRKDRPLIPILHHAI